MHSNKNTPLTHKSGGMISDDIKSLKKHLKTGSFDYIDITSLQAWEKSLQEWPLLAEWDVWSKQ